MKNIQRLEHNYGRKGNLSILIQDRFRGLEVSADGNDTEENEEKAVFRSAGARSYCSGLCKVLQQGRRVRESGDS